MNPKNISAESSILRGEFSPPGDKSISHRSIMFGALASGRSSITHFLEAEDCLATMRAFEMMGVGMDHQEGTGEVVIDGVGMQGLKAPEGGELYLGNSGTSMRLMMGVLAGQKMEVTLSGDDSLTSRPMQRVTKPLKQMGAQIKGRDHGNFAPLRIRGGRLLGIDYANKLGSAQVKSAILLAGLFAEGKTRVLEYVSSRDHTERFLASVGGNFYRDQDWLVVEKTDELKPFNLKVPGDISSAAFFIVGAAMTEGSEVTIREVNLNSTRTGVLEVLKRMGADISVDLVGEDPEPVGNIHIRGKRLKGTRIEKAEIPSLIDELPILMTAMALSEGESLISGAEELRVKETDRIQSMAENLTQVGAQVEELSDGCIIRGVQKLHGGKIKSFYDHRTIMSLVMATLGMEGEIEIDDITAVSTSFPGFFEAFESLKV